MISEIWDEPTPRPRGRPRTRVEVGDVIRLHLPHLVETGRVVASRTVQAGLTWDRADGSEVAVTITAAMSATAGRLTIRHRGGPSYAVEVVSAPSPFGGRRWWLVCPTSGARTFTLYLPPGAERFASRQAHRLGYRSQRVRARAGS